MELGGWNVGGIQTFLGSLARSAPSSAVPLAHCLFTTITTSSDSHVHTWPHHTALDEPSPQHPICSIRMPPTFGKRASDTSDLSDVDERYPSQPHMRVLAAAKKSSKTSSRTSKLANFFSRKKVTASTTGTSSELSDVDERYHAPPPALLQASTFASSSQGPKTPLKHNRMLVSSTSPLPFS